MRIRIPVSGRTFFLVFGGIFLCVGLVFTYTGVKDATRERAYQTRGRPAEAVVVSKSIVRAAREGNTSTRYEIEYRFTSDDGRTARGVAAVEVEAWERLQPGDAFPVTYLPGSPEASRAEGSSDQASALIMTALGSVLALVGGVVVARTGTRLWREWRLLREGMTATGTVLAIEPTSMAVNRVRQWQVRYRYQDHLGRPHEGASGPLPPDEAHAVSVGGALVVRFDRQHPAQSVWDRARTTSPEGTTGARGRWVPRLLKRVGSLAAMLGVFVLATAVGESVPALKTLERLMARHEAPLLAVTIGITALGFVLFMGGILHRIFAGAGEPMSRTEVEDLQRSVRMEARPVFGRVARYRFRGRSAGASFAEQFTLREAKEAWRQRAWRHSPRWRTNFIVMLGVLLFVPGLFSIFIVTGPNGVKLLCAAALVYAAVKTISGVTRA